MKKLFAAVAAGLAVFMTFGMAACSEEIPEKKISEDEYKAFIEGVYNMSSRTSSYSTGVFVDDETNEHQDGTIYFDAENKKVKTHSYLSKYVEGELTGYHTISEYYTLEGDKAYYYKYTDKVKHDVTQTVSSREGDSLWDKLVAYYILDEDFMMLDLLTFKNEDNPEGLGISEIYNYLTWDNRYGILNDYEIRGKKYNFGTRWDHQGVGYFDMVLGETEKSNVRVEIYMNENLETGKLLSKDYTDGMFDIYMWAEEEDGSEWSMHLRIRTFNLWWYGYNYGFDENDEPVYEFDDVIIPEDEYQTESN